MRHALLQDIPNPTRLPIRRARKDHDAEIMVQVTHALDAQAPRVRVLRSRRDPVVSRLERVVLLLGEAFERGEDFEGGDGSGGSSERHGESAVRLDGFAAVKLNPFSSNGNVAFGVEVVWNISQC